MMRQGCLPSQTKVVLHGVMLGSSQRPGIEDELNRFCERHRERVEKSKSTPESFQLH